MTVQGSRSGGIAAQYAAGTEPVQTGVAGGDEEGERGGMRQLLGGESHGREAGKWQQPREGS